MHRPAEGGENKHAGHQKSHYNHEKAESAVIGLLLSLVKALEQIVMVWRV